METQRKQQSFSLYFCLIPAPIEKNYVPQFLLFYFLFFDRIQFLNPP
jgi:hypothetical protein